ncbi:MAG: CD1871A family CXXC motif-containing protein [Negativibacillus sp.]|nr:CD1871A family CXXC motif-containing protein [Negativibacillus sp.]
MKQNRWTKVVPFVLLLLSGVLIAAGAFSGEAQLVLTKAINICMECIGIG